MNSTENSIPIITENGERIQNEELIENAEVMSVTKNISKVRLTLEEIIANDNDASRHQYLPSPKLEDDSSSVSSTFESDRGSIISTSSGMRSGTDSSSIMSAAFRQTVNDAFRGVEDEEFSNLDRYGFLASSSKSLSISSITEKEFMEKERLRL